MMEVIGDTAEAIKVVAACDMWCCQCLLCQLGHKVDLAWSNVKLHVRFTLSHCTLVYNTCHGSNVVPQNGLPSNTFSRASSGNDGADGEELNEQRCGER